MADLYGANDQSSSLESEEMSSFLQILLHNSSNAPSSSGTSFKGKHLPSFSSPPPPAPESASTTGLFFRSANIMSNSACRAGDGATTAGSSVIVDSTSGLNFSDPGGFFGVNSKEATINAFSSTGFSDSDAITSNSMKMKKHPEENEADDFSFDWERITEVSEVPVNSVPPPRASKRSRAAEIHNLSEKRRRSRINEKLKALQKLIPNSNKTDKASMLDEAIEYLKQLQLQVQMLSMRNGLSLHPIYLPGSLESVQLPPTGMDFNEGNGLLTRNRGTDAFSGNQEISMQPAFDLSNQCGPPNQPIIIPPVTNITNSGTLFGLEPSLHNHYGPFNPSSSKEICGDDKLSQVQ